MKNTFQALKNKAHLPHVPIRSTAHLPHPHVWRVGLSISYFSHCCDRNTQQNSLMEEIFILASGL